MRLPPERRRGSRSSGAGCARGGGVQGGGGGGVRDVGGCGQPRCVDAGIVEQDGRQR
jgi:hypothetical protein